MNKNKTTILTLRKKKETKTPVVWITSYNIWQSQLSNAAGVDMILIGDSLAMVELGMEGTVGVTMPEMISHTKAVVRGNSNAFLVGDMPFGSYAVSNEVAIRNAEQFIEAGCDAIKLEKAMLDRIRAISDAGILVCNHLGLLPQSEKTIGGHRVQSKDKAGFDKLMKDAKDVQDAGASMLLLEGVPNLVGGEIATALSIPVYGIGAGNLVDGQLLIFHDLMNLCPNVNPKFVKKYCDASSLMRNALTEYANEVRSHKFPTEEHFYKIDPELEGYLKHEN